MKRNTDFIFPILYTFSILFFSFSNFSANAIEEFDIEINGNTQGMVFEKYEKRLPTATPVPTHEVNSLMKKYAGEVVHCLKEKDFQTLSKYVHPNVGVFFDINFRNGRAINFSREKIIKSYEDTSEYQMFYGCVREEPFKGTFAEYFDRYVYRKDFASAPFVTVNEHMPGAAFCSFSTPFFEQDFVDFSCPDNGTKWKVLTLCFLPTKDSQWYLTGVYNSDVQKVIPPEEAKTIIEKRSWRALQALAKRDFKKFSKYVHPDKGVKIFETESDIRCQSFSTDEIRTIYEDETIRDWGFNYAERPVHMSFKDCFDKRWFAIDFTKAPEITYNNYVSVNAAIITVYQDYPDSIIAQYYYPATEEFDVPQKVSIALIFEKADDSQWYVTCLYHEGWSP